MVGKRIAIIRKNKNMSQEELAKRVGLAQTLISRIERGARKVAAEELINFATALGVPISSLLEEEGGDDVERKGA